MMIRTATCLFLGMTVASIVSSRDDVWAQPEHVPESVSDEVEEAVWRFFAADTARDAEAVINLLSPDFYMFVDGNRTTYEEVVAGTRQFMSGVTLFHSVWSDLRITPLGSDYAVASFTFRDSIQTVDGLLPQKKGPTTFVWSRTNNGWRLLYADADHYPVD